MNFSFRKSVGFTLIELLIVIAIIGILAAVVIIAVNPGRQLALANNAQRQSDANADLNALGQYAADYAGAYPAAIVAGGNYQIIGTATSGCDAPACSTVTTDAACVDLTAAGASLTPVYLTSMPTDPQTGTAAETRYAVERTTGTNPRVTVLSCDPQLGKTISITR